MKIFKLAICIMLISSSAWGLKIEKIESVSMTGDETEIMVWVEGYPHAQPVFPADITEKDLKIKLAEWKVNQDAVDLENANRVVEIATPVDISELKKLEGKEI